MVKDGEPINDDQSDYSISDNDSLKTTSRIKLLWTALLFYSNVFLLEVAHNLER